MPPPPWWDFCHRLNLPEELSRRWWEILCRSRWSEAYELRHDFFVMGASWPLPAHMVKVIENLVRENVLTRRTANQITAFLLKYTDSEGHWIGQHIA